jgi:threonine/homoserine/homoserine lactone efflux protein
MSAAALSLFAAYLVAATLLTLTPGLDTALILRTTSLEGKRKGLAAALGISVGCLVWGAAAALGIGALVAASRLAYDIIRYVGAAYLLWLGANLLLKPGHGLPGAAGGGGTRSALGWFMRGVTGNITNPKIGVFYASFLPQFCPPGYPPAPTMLGLTLVHVVLGIVWALVLIAAGDRAARFLKKPGPARLIDRLTGTLFIGFSLKLALERR